MTIQQANAPVFLLTGGSRGIGEAIAVSAARAGYFVLLTYVEKQGAADGVVARIRAAGGQAQALQVDTAKEADVLRMFAEADKLGRLAVLVYNSGITGPNSPLADVKTETLARVLDVNLLGAMVCAREAVRRMSTRGSGAVDGQIQGKGGSIVFLSSRATQYGAPGDYVWYAASKGGIDSLVNGLARELGTQGIRVNAVSPGVINTDIHPPGRLETVGKILPMQRAGEPDEVAAAVMFLASDAASYISGANLAVGGGADMRKATSRKVIITCAPTGSIHTPSMSPHLPVTPDQIAQAAIEAAEAGASILHLHARNPADGSPSPSAEHFMAFLPRIKAATDAVINISTGGSATMSLDARLEGAKAARPEVCSLNMGPLIFDFSAAGTRVENWQHGWERPYVEGSRNRIMYNDNGYIERIMREVGHEFGTRFEFECYDIGHLYTLAHFVERKLVTPPFLIQGVFGILGGIGADPRNLAHMVTIADSLFGDDYVFSAFAAGRNQLPFCLQSALLGGNCRVGLEDSLYIGPGHLARSNADQVRKIRSMLEELGLEIATPADVRAILALKGPATVGF